MNRTVFQCCPVNLRVSMTAPSTFPPRRFTPAPSLPIADRWIAVVHCKPGRPTRLSLASRYRDSRVRRTRPAGRGGLNGSAAPPIEGSAVTQAPPHCRAEREPLTCSSCTTTCSQTPTTGRTPAPSPPRRSLPRRAGPWLRSPARCWSSPSQPVRAAVGFRGVVPGCRGGRSATSVVIWRSPPRIPTRISAAKPLFAWLSPVACATRRLSPC